MTWSCFCSRLTVGRITPPRRQEVLSRVMCLGVILRCTWLPTRKSRSVFVVFGNHKVFFCFFSNFLVVLKSVRSVVTSYLWLNLCECSFLEPPSQKHHNQDVGQSVGCFHEWCGTRLQSELGTKLQNSGGMVAGVAIERWWIGHQRILGCCALAIEEVGDQLTWVVKSTNS